MSILKNLGELAFNMAKAKAVDYIKDIQLKSEAAHLTDESRVQFHTGDLVRDDKMLYRCKAQNCRQRWNSCGAAIWNG